METYEAAVCKLRDAFNLHRTRAMAKKHKIRPRTQNTASSHGGELTRGKRKSKRPLATDRSLHVVLKSDRATGARSLIRHYDRIQTILNRSRKRFGIKIHGQAVHFNHIHLHIRGRSRRDIQNFFRVVCGHIAQFILSRNPLEWACKRERKFWRDLVFSRVVAAGQDFRNVRGYLDLNLLEVELQLARAGRSRAPWDDQVHLTI